MPAVVQCVFALGPKIKNPFRNTETGCIRIGFCSSLSAFFFLNGGRDDHEFAVLFFDHSGDQQVFGLALAEVLSVGHVFREEIGQSLPVFAFHLQGIGAGIGFAQ